MATGEFALAPGTVLVGEQRYVIERLLGAGGFGMTYLASTTVAYGNIKLKGYVAIKEHFLSDHNEREAVTLRVTTPGTARSRELVANSLRDFLGEARRLRGLGAGHPDIVKVNEVFEANGTAYYVMEYLDGNSLWSGVNGRGMTEDDMRAVMHPIIDAVAYLHRNRLTHLDIKPQNIMLACDDNGATRPVLIDFGLSKHYDGEGHATSTVNTLACSDGYSPVEQYSGITTFSPAADVYALGATMLACLTGKTPPKSTEWPAAERLRYVDSLSVSDSLREALRGALAESNSRLADADALLAALSDSKTTELQIEDFTETDNATKIISVNLDENEESCLDNTTTTASKEYGCRKERTRGSEKYFAGIILTSIMVYVALFIDRSNVFSILTSLISVVALVKMSYYRKRKLYKFHIAVCCLVGSVALVLWKALSDYFHSYYYWFFRDFWNMERDSVISFLLPLIIVFGYDKLNDFYKRNQIGKLIGAVFLIVLVITLALNLGESIELFLLVSGISLFGCVLAKIQGNSVR